MRRTKFRCYRDFLRELREVCPTLVPVVTSRRKLTDCIAYCNLIRKDDLPHHFVIVIDSALSWEATWQVLVHEWAHALAWNEDSHTVTDHGPEFGIAYSRIWEDLVEI